MCNAYSSYCVANHTYLWRHSKLLPLSQSFYSFNSTSRATWAAQGKGHLIIGSLEPFFGNTLPETVLSGFPVTYSLNSGHSYINSLGSLYTKLLTQSNESRIWFRRYFNFKSLYVPDATKRDLEGIELCKSWWIVRERAVTALYYHRALLPVCAHSPSERWTRNPVHMFHKSIWLSFLGLIWWRIRSCSHALQLLTPPQLDRVPRTLKRSNLPQERDRYDWYMITLPCA